MRILENAIVRLEPQTVAHAAEMFETLSDPAIYKHESKPPPSLEWLKRRFAFLECRTSPDAREFWLNWVIRIPTSELIGYVQATVYANRDAAIAYELNSRHWGKGLASAAVALMIDELVAAYGVHTLGATLKKTNLRSLRLLQRFHFKPAGPHQHPHYKLESDERFMLRPAVFD